LLSSHVPHFSCFMSGKDVANVRISEEMTNFETALREIVQVSKDELKRLQAEDRARKVDKPKRGPKPVARRPT
jgi:hypothetical protein